MKTLGILFFLAIQSPAFSRDLVCKSNAGYDLENFHEHATGSQSLEEVVSKLPEAFRKNFTLKRGNNIEKTINGVRTILGPHGHLAPESESASASPEEPRVFVFDQGTGFTASWNGGSPNQTANDRIDIYSFDFLKKEHHLESWTAKEGIADQNLVDKNGRRCTTCHGNAQRPIFPMYPDWPQFFGEFNDEMAGYGSGEEALRPDLKEMANAFQPEDRALYLDFLSKSAKTNARYSPLYANLSNADKRNSFFPFRPRNTTSPATDTSRAFFHRPNLRLGVLFNRLSALRNMEKIKQSAVFQKFPDIVFYSLLDCSWDLGGPNGQTDKNKILSNFLKALKANPEYSQLNLRGARFSKTEVDGNEKSFFQAGENEFYKSPALEDANYRQIPYEDLLKLLNIDLKDLDIRFRYDASMKANGFNIYDPRAYYFTNSAMDLGYIENTYDLNPICDADGKSCQFSYEGTYMQGMRYFNSYFDGSATSNELLAAQTLLYLMDERSSFPSADLKNVQSLLKTKIKDPTTYFETLRKKYSRFTARMELDEDFFAKMDSLSPWIQLPFPPDLLNIHNREPFWGDSDRTSEIRSRHAQWNGPSEKARNERNLNDGENLCWNVYESMKARYLK